MPRIQNLEVTDQHVADKIRVLYQPYPGAPEEVGYITSFNESYVSDCYDHTGRGQATPTSKLKWEFLGSS